MSDLTSAAGKRITSLLDANSFVEIGSRVTARSTDFNLGEAKAPSDGVITGYGTVDGGLVYIYSQDTSVMNGTLGEMHARKIVNIYRLARKTGAPIVGMIDCGGLRLQESTDALNALGKIYKCEVMASGVIPQITAIFGNCGGGLSIVPALSDFTYLESSKGRLFVNSPDAIRENNADKLDTSAADFQTKTGNVDFIGTEEEIFSNMRALLSMLPCNNEDEGEITPCSDDLNRACTGIESTLQDAGKALEMIADCGIFTETRKDFGPGIITGFMKLNGSTVGAIANRGDSGELMGKAVQKAAKFLSFCDAFNIPVLTLVNAQGFARTNCSEERMPGSAADLIFAYANATVPKVTVVTGKAFGTPYVIMGSGSIGGADMTYAWKDAEIGAMDADAAAKIIFDGQDADTIKEGAKNYRDLQLNVNSAAARGYVDTVIDPADTRKYVIGALEMLYTKRENRPDRKHGTV